MILTGEPITAERAREIGLVNHLVPAGEALAPGAQARGDDRGERAMAVLAAKAVPTEAAHWRGSDAFALQRRYLDPVRGVGIALYLIFGVAIVRCSGEGLGHGIR